MGGCGWVADGLCNICFGAKPGLSNEVGYSIRFEDCTLGGWVHVACQPSLQQLITLNPAAGLHP